MLPIDSRQVSKGSRPAVRDAMPEYFRRLCDFRQMDFESAFDQLLGLLSTEPQRVYATFYYRKQTRNQWARDDPAFFVLVTFFVVVSALAYATVFCDATLWSYTWAVLYSVVVDWLLIGLLVAFSCCHAANKYLRQHHSHTVEQDVEWLYSLDVHTNAYFCSFLITHVLQFFLLPVLLGKSVLSCVLSNTLYAIAMIWYAYITHLGYRALPFLGNTQVFLWYPIVGVSSLLIFSLVLLVLACG